MSYKMRLIIGGTRSDTKIPLIFSTIVAVLLINCSSSTEWRGISDSEFKERSLKLENNQANKVQSPERWRAKQIISSRDSLIQGSSNHEKVLSLGTRVESDFFLKRELSKPFKPSSTDERKLNEQASPETTSPYVLEIRYDDDHKHSSFLDLMGAGTRAREKVPPEVIQVPLAGASFGHSAPSSFAALRSNVEDRVEFPKAINTTSASLSASATASNSSNVLSLVNHTTSEAKTKTLASREVQYHPHISYKPERNDTENKAENFQASNVDTFRQFLLDETDASSSTLAPQPSNSPPARMPNKIVTKISPLGNTAADALGANARTKPSEVSGYRREAERVQFIDLGTLGHDADLKPHALLQEMKKLIAAHAPKIDSGRSSLVLFHKNKKIASQGDVQTSHALPGNKDRIQISTHLELPIHPNQTASNSPSVEGKAAASSLPSETIGNALYVQSVTPPSVLGKPNQDVVGKDVVGAKIDGLEHASASDDTKVPVQVKFHDKLIPVTAFIDPKSAPLPGVHFVLNPWVYKFPPWFEPHNPPPPGASFNATDLLQGDIIIDLEGLQNSSKGDKLVNVRVPSFSRFKDEVIKTILEANLKERSRKGKTIDHKVSKKRGENSLNSEVTSETYPKKAVSVIRDTDMNLELAPSKHDIGRDLNGNKQLNFYSTEPRSIELDEQQPAYGATEHDPVDHDAGSYHNDNGPKHGGPKSFGSDTSYEDNDSHGPYYDRNQSHEKYGETNGASFREHPYRGHTNSDVSSSYHDASHSTGEGTHFDGNFESRERFSGDLHHNGEEKFEAYQEQIGDEFDDYSSTPVYGTPHYHTHSPYNVGYSGPHEEADSYYNSEYNQSGERDLSRETGSDKDEHFRDNKSGAKEPVYTSHYSGGNSEAPDHYPSSAPTHFETVDSSFHQEPISSNHDHYNGNEYPRDSRGQHESVALYKNEPAGSSDSDGFSHNYNSGELDFYPHSSGNHGMPNTGRYRDSPNHFGNGGSVNNYNPKTENYYVPHTGDVTLKSNPHYHSKFEDSNGGKSGLVSGKMIFRDDIVAGKLGMHRIKGSKDYAGTTTGQFSPSSGYRHPVLKPFKPSPLDPTSGPTSLLNQQSHINHFPPGKLPEPNQRRPHGYAYKDKYSSVFISNPQYLRSIYGPSDNFPFKYNTKSGSSTKPFTPNVAVNSNYVLTPHKYYYNDHRSHPIMSSGHAVTYWVPSKHNFYRSPSRRHDLVSNGSGTPEEEIIVGVHPATRDDVEPSPKLLPPRKRILERNSGTPRLSEGLDLLPYFNDLHRNKKRKNKLNISVPMSYSGTSLRNLSAIEDDSPNKFQKPLSRWKSKEHSSAGLSVDIIYGSRKNSGPMSPHLAIKNRGSTQHVSRFVVTEESLHESDKPSSKKSSHEFVPRPLLLSSPSVVRRLRSRDLRETTHGTPSSWYWPEGLQI
ncbi:hypothetical protein FHG87_008746 [Trinorchestia longiramus]|nr:hypothetical protein FHG87_008746 [Trinorchestia longiramus]